MSALAVALCAVAAVSGLGTLASLLTVQRRRWELYAAVAVTSLGTECALERAWVDVAVYGVLLSGLGGRAAWKRWRR